MQVHPQYPAFVPGSSKVTAGFVGFCIFGPKFALTVHAVIFSPIQFPCILLLKVCSAARIATLQQRVPGPACFIPPKGIYVLILKR